MLDARGASYGHQIEILIVVMGKKSKRQGAAAQRQQVDASLTSKAVCRIVDELWNSEHK